MSEPLLTPGMLVGETWEIIEPIGRGGMGEVWLAKHVRVEGKQAAIKVLRRTTDGMPDQVARFRREAEIAAKLEHPNIVQLFDFSSLPSGAPYLVMELLRGESLGKRLERGVMPLAELQEVVIAIGSALHVAHAAGVVHRDLKPENIFLVSTSTGTAVKVLDFGISKLVGSDSVMTSEDIVLGTPQYMSPEQAMAEHQTITGQSDLFSLGTICFEALTGHRPFAASTLARTVYLVAMEPSPLLAAYGPDLPPHVIAAVDRALAKHAVDRTPDAATFVKELCGVSISASGAQALPRPVVKVEPRAPRNPNAETVSGRAQAPLATKKRRVAPLIAMVAGLVLATVLVVVPLDFARGERGDSADAGLVVPLDFARGERGDSADAGLVVAVSARGERGDSARGERDAGLAVVTTLDAGLAVIHDAGTHRLLPLKTQPTTAEQQEFLESARAAASREEWSRVIEWTLKPAIAERSDAITLRMLAWCHLGNLSMVSAYKTRLPPAERGTVARACKAQGIDL